MPGPQRQHPDPEPAPTEPGPRSEAAEFYDQMWRDCRHLDAASPAALHRRRLVVEWAREAAPTARRLIDVGCGEGALLRQLGEAFPNSERWGADVSQQALLDARLRDPGCQTVRLDLEDPEFSRRYEPHLASFDLVTCSEVLEHLKDDRMALEHLRDLLVPGGVLILTVPGGRPTRFDLSIGHRRHYDPVALEAALEEVGLCVHRVVAWGFPFHSLYRSLVRLASAAVAPSDGGAASGRAARLRSGLLGWGYRALGLVLTPLFYLNLPRRGQQVLALGRRPRGAH